MTLPAPDLIPAGLEPVFRYWERKRGDRRMPRRADIDPAELVRYLPALMIVDVVADERCYVYRLVGTREVEARGRDPTGRAVGEAFIGASREGVFANYDRVRLTGRPHVDLKTIISNRDRLDNSHVIFLPLSEDGETVTQILVLYRLQSGMKFAPPLVEARLVQRYKRFLADVEIPGAHGGSAVVTVHCPNPGSMMGLAEPGSRCWLMPKTGTKLPYCWELVESHASGVTALVGINTARANAVVAEGLAGGVFGNLPGATVSREVQVGPGALHNSRLDFRLADADGNPCWVEVKSVTLSRRAGIAEFPDAKTDRGSRHLAELGALAEAGQRAVLLFLVQRNDCREMAIAADIDPTYAAGLTQARAQGVEIRAFSCRISALGIDAGPEIAFIPG